MHRLKQSHFSFVFVMFVMFVKNNCCEDLYKSVNTNVLRNSHSKVEVKTFLKHHLHHTYKSEIYNYNEAVNC